MKKRALFSILPVGFTTKRESGKDLDKFFRERAPFFRISSTKLIEKLVNVHIFFGKKFPLKEGETARQSTKSNSRSYRLTVSPSRIPSSQ